MRFTSWAQRSCFWLGRLLGFGNPWVPFLVPQCPILNEKYWNLSSHRSCCWILPTAQRPLPLPPPQEPRKQSDAAADAILLGRGSSRRIGASSLSLFLSSIGYPCQSSASYWLREFTFFGGLLLRRSTSFDPLHLFIEGPVHSQLTPKYQGCMLTLSRKRSFGSSSLPPSN